MVVCLCRMLSVFDVPPVRQKFTDVSQQIYVLRGEIVNLTPKLQPGGPGYPFLSGSAPLTRLARDVIPVVSLLPDSSQDHLTTQAPPLRQSRDTSVGCNSYKNVSVFTNIQNITLHFRNFFRWNRSPEEGTNAKHLCNCCLQKCYKFIIVIIIISQ